ncbi:hypothetical protein F5B21DRAFT_481652 [Xylaria acuta]|nr:hypothetical protein F5B21DRAFT_481652 [Xylaria acuta]
MLLPILVATAAYIFLLKYTTSHLTKTLLTYLQVNNMCVIYTTYYSCGHVRGTRREACPRAAFCNPTHQDGDTSITTCGATTCHLALPPH